MSGKKKYVVSTTDRDRKVVEHAFASKKEVRAFIRGLSITDWISYTFLDEAIR